MAQPNIKERLLKDGKFELELPRTILTQLEADSDQPLERYEGSADISLNEQGRLQLRFLCRSLEVGQLAKKGVGR